MAYAPWDFGVAIAAADGTKMVLELSGWAKGVEFKGLQEEYAQSIIGATLKRREGSGRVVCGVEAVSRDILVYAFMYHFRWACWVRRW